MPPAQLSPCWMLLCRSPTLLEEAHQSGNLAIPFVRQLTAAVWLRSEDAARSVHWGATSQDLLDTALVLRCVRRWR